MSEEKKITDKVSDERLREMFVEACELHNTAKRGNRHRVAAIEAEYASVFNELLSARTALAAYDDGDRDQCEEG